MDLVITCRNCGSDLVVNEGIVSFSWQVRPCTCVAEAAYERGKAEAEAAADQKVHQSTYNEGYAAGHKDAVDEIREAAGKIAAAGNGKGG